MMKSVVARFVCLFLTLAIAQVAFLSAGAEAAKAAGDGWQLGEPIVTYWCGPKITDESVKRMADGGWNLVWCNTEQEMDIVQRHGLRAMFHHGLITSPDTLDKPAKRKELDALIARVSKHPALYCYYVKDEPSTAEFPWLAKIVGYLREHDPKHLAYINLYPTYANNKQLGTKGETVPAYREHLRQFIDVVKPALISYDHYQFTTNGDTDQYFLNLAMVREASQQAGLPFLNIVQSCTWDKKNRRVPNGDEMRYLVYTTLAYGAKGISYYVYRCPNSQHEGGIVKTDGSPTPLYAALKPLNHEFTTILQELKGLKSLGAYHAGMIPVGGEALPKKAAFRLDPPRSDTPHKGTKPIKGILLGFFGPAGEGKSQAAPTHALVVNLDYKNNVIAKVVGDEKLEVFDATTGKWSGGDGKRMELKLPPGGGKLVRTGRGG